MAKLLGISNAVKALKSLQFGKNEYIPWGDTSYLVKKDDLNLLPRAHLRRHLFARGDDGNGKRVELCICLEKSIKHEIEEQRRVEEEREKRHQEIAAQEEKGAVYCVGSNNRGQLGMGDLEKRNMFTPIPMTRGLGVQQVSTRNDISFAVTGSHCVFTWGSGGKGPMALDCKQKRANFQSPQLIESLEEEDILDVAVGLNHACARNEIAVYSWGCGCLGNDNTNIQELPDLISFETHEVMSNIVSGEMHCAALSESGKVWTWGVGANGRLGSGNLTGFGFIPLPKEIKLSFQIVMISCGSEHTVASSKTRIFSWGANDGARLGHGDCKDRFEPCEIVRLSGLTILDISCGTWHTSCIAASPPMQNCGWLYTWGSGYSGQLGLESVTSSSVPALVPFFLQKQLPLISIFCGSHHNAVITAEKDLYTWGLNQSGCLGRDIEEAFVAFTSKPGYCQGFGTIVGRIGRGLPISVAIGRDYTIVCTDRYEGLTEEEVLSKVK